ncbi:MAG: ParB N-terminal domain-containing protein, partial [Clostridiales bacterium]|nr:ParB N-terminal domain-containing protein [Clostridiales bacterium]
SIRQHGIIQPITVRQVDKGLYQIIAGERRWRASRMAGLKEIPRLSGIDLYPPGERLSVV